MDFDGYSCLSSDDDNSDDGICVSRHYSSDESSDEADPRLQWALDAPTGAASADDAFDAEMNSELDSAMNLHTSGSAAAAGGRPSQYDGIYFDSDDDEKDEGVQKRRTALSDADLLYDPTLDDKDQLWVDQRRYGVGRPQKHGARDGSSRGDVPATDAVLNCPACLTTLCVQCQRHAVYGNQYRAMFVLGCKVDYTEMLSYPSKMDKKQKWKLMKKERKSQRKRQNSPDLPESNSDCVGNLGDNVKKVRFSTNKSTASSGESADSVTNGAVAAGCEATVDGEAASSGSAITSVSAVQHKANTAIYKCNINTSSNTSNEVLNSHNDCALFTADSEEKFYSVSCQHCNTKVAVMDAEEIYHFFNVITSY